MNNHMIFLRRLVLDALINFFPSNARLKVMKFYSNQLVLASIYLSLSSCQFGENARVINDLSSSSQNIQSTESVLQSNSDLGGELVPLVDSDGDGVMDNQDNCLNVANPLQIDTNSDGFGNICDPDVDNNGRIGILDYGIWAAAYGGMRGDQKFNPDVDFNNDGRVGISDFGIWAQYFGKTPGPSGLGDADADGWAGSFDNCPLVANPSQGEAFKQFGPYQNELLNHPYDKINGVDPNLLSLDAYWNPALVGKPNPMDVVIAVHGGSWQTGDKAGPGFMENKVEYFTKTKDMIFVSLNYRLSDAVKMPTHPEDVAKAISYVACLLPDSNIWLMGHSSGSHLVSLVATNERFLQHHGLSLSRIKGVIAVDSGYYDMMANKDSREWGNFVKKVFTDDHDTQIDISPIEHVAPGKAIPPFFIIYTGKGKREKISLSFENKLFFESGINAKAVHAQRYDHPTVISELGKPDDPLTGLVGRFIDGEDPRGFPDLVDIGE